MPSAALTSRPRADVTVPAAPLMSAARRWLLPGLLAGAAFLIFEMAVGALTTTAWAFPEGIAQTAGIGRASYGLQAVPLLAGVAMHLTMGTGLGVIFIAITRRLRLTGKKALASAVAFSCVETFVVIWVVLDSLLPATLPRLFNAVPIWASVAGHLGFGLVLGLLVACAPAARARS